MANTNILIKRSLTTSAPSSLKQGELAYSYNSNTIFLGSPTGDGAIKIGGQYYTNQIDNATATNVPNTIVKRDATGNSYFGNVIVSGYIQGTISGVADAANRLTTARTFSISGGDISASGVSFDGTGNVTLNASLNTIDGLSAGTYGSSSSIPVVSVAANGRVTSISSASISSSFTVAGNSGSGQQDNGGTLTIQGSSGITTSVTGSGGNETVTVTTDNTIARTNTSGAAQVFNTDINLPTNNISAVNAVFGNVTVSGTLTQYNATSTLNVGDPIIYLAANNTGNAVDIGVVGHFVGTGHSGGPSQYQHTGFVRDYIDNKWKLFSNVVVEPTTTVTFDANTWYDTIKVGGVDLSNGALSMVATANIASATIDNLYLTNALPVSQGGMGSTTHTAGQILVGNGTGAVSSLANTGTAGTYGSASYIPVVTTDSYGRVSAVSNTQVQIDVSNIISGTLGYTRGGTGSTSYSTGQLLVSGPSGFTNIANTGTAGTYGSASYIPVVTTDVYGRVSSVSNTQVQIDTSNIISGTLGVNRGGTGASSFTSGQIVIGNGTGALQQLANVTAFANTTIDPRYTVTSFNTDVYGRVTTFSTSPISGLTVGQGGTGASSFTTNGIIYGNSGSAMQVTAAAGTSDQTFSNQILTVTNAGVPVWTNALDGGTF